MSAHEQPTNGTLKEGYDMDALKKALKKLSLEEKRELVLMMDSELREAEKAEKQVNDAKLKKFARAVRHAGLLRDLKGVRKTVTRKVDVKIEWGYLGHIDALEGPDGIDVAVVGQTPDEALKKTCAKDVKALQKRVYNVFQKVKQMAVDYDVHLLDYEESVLFLWEEE